MACIGCLILGAIVATVYWWIKFWGDRAKYVSLLIPRLKSDPVLRRELLEILPIVVGDSRQLFIKNIDPNAGNVLMTIMRDEADGMLYIEKIEKIT